MIMTDSLEFYRKQTQNQHEKFIVRYSDDDYTDKAPPSRYYIVNSFGFLVFVKVREREKAQEVVDSVYGKGFYKIRFMGLESGDKEISAR
jgi:hypothetical protein